MKRVEVGLYLEPQVLDSVRLAAELLARGFLRDFNHSSELLHYRRFLRLVGVQFKAERSESDFFQTFLHDFKGGHLLGHEKHFLALVDGVGDYVGDGLALACARRPVKDEALAAHRGFDGLQLG